MGTIVHVELTSPDPQASADFYARAFGWDSTASPFLPDYLTSRTGDGSGIDAAIMSSRYQEQKTILWIEVPDIADAVTAVEAAGGTAGEFHDLPGQGRVGYVTDPAGVVIGLKQPA
ncbi:VOC family protein [Pseudonocardia nematodicida]|uniref:VOC family protein n=1 Tax=Pseudonocardia nematodicida TaxID=1206997 RepID=A0ABV1KJZ6_9PSEU